MKIKTLKKIIKKLKELGFVNEKNIDEIEISKNGFGDDILHIRNGPLDVIPVIYKENKIKIITYGESIPKSEGNMLYHLLDYVKKKYGNNIISFETNEFKSHFKFKYKDKIIEFFEEGVPYGSPDPDFIYNEQIIYIYYL